MNKVGTQVAFEEAGDALRGGGVPEAPVREVRDAQLARLIGSVATGDGAALRELHGLTVGRVYGIALRIVRTREAALIHPAQGFDASAHDEDGIFAALRQWKNEFQ